MGWAEIQIEIVRARTESGFLRQNDAVGQLLNKKDTAAAVSFLSDMKRV